MKNFSNERARKSQWLPLTKGPTAAHLLTSALLGALLLVGFVVRAYNHGASLEEIRARHFESLPAARQPHTAGDPETAPVGSATVASVSSATGPPVNTPRPGRRAQSSQQIDKRGLHTVTFGLYDAGIEPDVIHTRKGLVAVLIEDVSGGTKGLLVERETGSGRIAIGQVLRAGPASQASWRGRSEFMLEPGTYRVTDTSRPQNFAQLIVEP